MGLFKLLFGRKTSVKGETVKIEILGQSYNTGLTAEQLNEISETPEYKANRKDRDLKIKIFDQKEKVNEYAGKINRVLNLLQEINDLHYFTFQEKFIEIKRNVEALRSLPKDENYQLGIKNAVEWFKESYGKKRLSLETKKFISDPVNYDDATYHRQKLDDSANYLFEYWRYQVKALKQPSARTKRIKYVVDGYQTLREELITLCATSEEIQGVDLIIQKISDVQWWDS